MYNIYMIFIINSIFYEFIASKELNKLLNSNLISTLKILNISSQYEIL